MDVGGGGGGRCPSTNSCAISDRASFLPVKSSIVDLVNIRTPGYRHSRDRFSQGFPVFRALPLPCMGSHKFTPFETVTS